MKKYNMDKTISGTKLRKIEDCKGKLKDIIGNEGILHLAKEGICPHYVIINPITKEETIWFIASELNRWLDENYIKHKDGHFTPEYHFIYLDKKLYKPKNDVPEELLKIHNLYQLPIDNIHTPPGVYFLCKDKEIRYVGKSINVAHRLMYHIAENTKEFNAVFYIPCPYSKLTEIESALIRYFRPMYNTNIGKAREEDDYIINSVMNKSNDLLDMIRCQPQETICN